MEKRIIGIDIANQPDSTVVFIHFWNDGNYNETAVNMPILYQGKSVGVITKVNKDYVNGYIHNMKFYQEILMNDACSGVSFEIKNGDK